MVKCGTEIENCDLMDFFIVRKKKNQFSILLPSDDFFKVIW